jgi:hypothetical protein
VVLPRGCLAARLLLLLVALPGCSCSRRQSALDASVRQDLCHHALTVTSGLSPRPTSLPISTLPRRQLFHGMLRARLLGLPLPPTLSSETHSSAPPPLTRWMWGGDAKCRRRWIDGELCGKPTRSLKKSYKNQAIKLVVVGQWAWNCKSSFVRWAWAFGL